tara:strand:- start:251 stop:619 length:369 start_codon:yes stop_codon:yes gene_type:complete
MWIAKFNKPYKEKIKKLTFNFADIKKGETMLVSSPSSIAKYIHKIPKGKKKTVIEMREALAKKAKANKTCPVSTGIFLRIAIEASLEEQIKKKKLKNQNFLFGELLTKNLLLQRNYLYLKSF